MRKFAPLLTSFLAACGSAIGSAPEIGRDLPAIYAEGERVFDQRIRQRFPIGSPERDLSMELERQGFRRLPGWGGIEDATFTRAGFMSETIWSVRWRSRDGRITEIWGVYGVSAP